MPPIATPRQPRKRVPPRQRNDLLVKWLSPQEEGDREAGRFVGRPVREIAKAFNRHFHVQVCERTVLRYIHEAVAASKRRAETDTWIATKVGRQGVSVEAPTFSLLPRGRPKSDTQPTPRQRKKKSGPVCLPPKVITLPPTPPAAMPRVVAPAVQKKRPLQVVDSVVAPTITPLARGRPRPDTPPVPGRRKKKLESACPRPKLIGPPPTPSAVMVHVAPSVQMKTHLLETVPEPVSKPSRGKPGPKPRFKRWSRVWWELQALTGWSARTLYHHLKGFPALQPLLGSRASFFSGAGRSRRTAPDLGPNGSYPGTARAPRRCVH